MRRCFQSLVLSVQLNRRCGIFETLVEATGSVQLVHCAWFSWTARCISRFLLPSGGTLDPSLQWQGSWCRTEKLIWQANWHPIQALLYKQFFHFRPLRGWELLYLAKKNGDSGEDCPELNDQTIYVWWPEDHVINFVFSDFGTACREVTRTPGFQSELVISITYRNFFIYKTKITQQRMEWSSNELFYSYFN